MGLRSILFIILVLASARTLAQTYSLSATPSTLTFNVTTSPSDPQSYSLRNTGNSFMYVMISPSAHTQISFNGGTTWLSVNNNAYLINPGSTIVVHVRVVTSEPIASLNEQVSNSRFTYATPTAPVQISGVAPLPVSLASFSAMARAGDSVDVRWKTISETGCYGFVIQGRAGDEWTDVSPLIPGHGTTIITHEYAYTAHAGSLATWRLCQIDLDGSRSYSEATVTTDVAPASGLPDFALDGNYPNPFNPSTTIRYGLSARTHVLLAVFNSLGQQIAVLQDGPQEGGVHDVVFNAQGLPSGAYYYRLTAGSYTETRSLRLVR
jgi:hypothetical protein